MTTHDTAGPPPISRWQRGVPVYNEPVVTPALLFFGLLAVVGIALSVTRLFSPLGPFSGMNDAYAWGIWKTFNVMTLTALGSGPLAVGMAAWVFNRHKLHVVMRPAVVTGFLFYATGLTALGFDVGRPWNFWSIMLPWRWNSESAMLEVAVCMPVYCAAFLAFENVPLVLERFYHTGNEVTKERLRRLSRILRPIFPIMITGSYVLPMMHQSSLGGLLLLAGDKVHPLWQTPFLPLLYVLAACVAGDAFVTCLLLISCLRYSRRLDLDVLGEMGSLLSWLCFIFLAVRFGDLAWRRELGAAFALDRMSLLFLAETLLILVPAVALRRRAARETPRALLNMSALACLGAMLYRFTPTTIAFNPGRLNSYFPSLPEVLMAIGYIAICAIGFSLAVKLFAVLPAERSEWNGMFGLARPYARRRRPAAQ
jgi:Ni/Fe-hydrogenase subunit HybB-like protein